MIDIVFLGTPDFAVPSLRALVENGYRVKAVITQPDRPKGRGNKLCASPVKEYALAHSIPVFQPEKIKNQPEILNDLAPDLMITAAFGQILSAENLASARLGCVNVHGSLLPAYRGSSPIQWAVINGEKTTGITTMYTALGVDTGDIILQEALEIGESETAGELFDRMAELGAKTLIKTVKLIESGTAPRTAQDDSKATHFPMLDKEKAKIDFSKSAEEVKNLVRGVNPWPVAWTEIGNEVFKVYAASCVQNTQNVPAGKIICADEKQGLTVACASGAVSLDIIQAPGKKAMSAKDYLRGHKIGEDAR